MGSAINTTSTAQRYGDMRDYRAPSLLQPHHARQAIRDAHEGKRPPLNSMFSMLSNPQLIRILAQLGFDIIMLDQEHAAMNVETMTSMVHDIQHISEGRTVAWVRVSGHDHDMIGYALDAGASIMIPQINNAAEAQHALSATKFGVKNKGTRSAPPIRYIPGFSAETRDGVSIWEALNRQAAVIIQLESQEAVRNLDDILTQVKDIDACWLGSLDVRASMGLVGPWGDEPEFLETVELFKETLRKHDMPASGAVVGTPEMKSAVGGSYAVASVAMDMYSLVEASVGAIKEAKEIFPAKNMSTKEAMANGGRNANTGDLKIEQVGKPKDYIEVAETEFGNFA